MNRAARRYKRWDRGMREWAQQSSRELALDLYYGRARPLSSYGIGVSLGPGEILYREVWARYWTLGQRLSWSTTSAVHASSRRFGGTGAGARLS